MRDKEMANTEQYRAVLEDLIKQRDQLSFKIGEIDTAVAALRRIMPTEDIAQPRDSRPPQQGTLLVPTNDKYAGMSMRWAILAFLAEDAARPQSTGDIAVALQGGGLSTNGKNFAGNVSAVLSGMNHDRNEVSNTPEGWVISPHGKNAWIAIKASRERKQQASEASLPILQ